MCNNDLCIPGVQFLLGQQGKKTYQPIVLRFTFHSFYNSYRKSCCKLYPSCDNLLDSAGFIAESLKGRVTFAEGDGWIEFNISHVRSEDAGYYRCMVVEFQDTFTDYNVKLSGKSNHSQFCLALVKLIIIPYQQRFRMITFGLCHQSHQLSSTPPHQQHSRNPLRQ